MNETYDAATMQAIIEEARKQGYQDDFIAGQLNITLDDDVFFAFNENVRSLGLELSGIAEGFREWQFYNLPETLKREILILLARLHESGYRRGAYQGWTFCDAGQKLKIPLDKLRFGNESLDSARMPLCGNKMSSRERLSIQHGFALAMLGFDSILDDLQ